MLLPFRTRCCSLAATIALCALTLVIPVRGRAQEITGTILGVVTDSSGAVVPGAKVTITNDDRHQVERTLPTNKDGQYSAPLLPVGRYTVTFRLA